MAIIALTDKANTNIHSIVFRIAVILVLHFVESGALFIFVRLESVFGMQISARYWIWNLARKHSVKTSYRIKFVDSLVIINNPNKSEKEIRTFRVITQQQTACR